MPENAQKATKEAMRTLNRNGYIFINIPNRVSWVKAKKEDAGHVWLPTIREMKDLLVNTGFKKDSIRHFTRGFPISNQVRMITGSDLRLPLFGKSIFISAQK